MPELREDKPKESRRRSGKKPHNKMKRIRDKSFGNIDERGKSTGIKKQNLMARNKGVRINKYIADSGLCSRRKADEYIEAGTVKINRRPVKEQGVKVMPGDLVTVKGDPIYPEENAIYILLNKPKDTITTSDDEFDRRTVMNFVRIRKRIFPVGRLDRNTTGALLLTNDGELANRLTHPKYHIVRTYNVKLDKELTPETAQKIADGVEIDGKKTAPCEIVVHPDSFDKCILHLIEGRNREVRRMFEAVGYDVKQLDRKVFADLSTSGLPRGKYRVLKPSEVNHLKRITGMI